ncbi:MAG: DUF21 domain-containing protein [Bacteroidales bacterium]|nr:MAG: DUF21 domain-containing protein [Bacteroidales bacterium]
MAEIIGTNTLTWIGIIFCISQSAMFSGLNLAFFSIPRLRLEVEAANNNQSAIKVLHMRKDSNFLLTTILWGNVGINVLLTLLSKSVMAGISAFIFSTFLITIVGEIVPQAYFSRHALKMASFLAPVMRIYQYLLFPVTKSSAILLNWWLGPESIHYFKEKSLQQLISKHIKEDSAEINHVEGIGAINFLALDDLLISQEGELINPESIIKLPCKNNIPVFADYKKSPDDPFLKKINASGEKWVIITNYKDVPVMVMDSDGFLRTALFDRIKPDPLDYCHHPIIVNDPSIKLGDIIHQLKITPESQEDDVIDQDIILLWGEKKQIITGADILGRLLRGIVNS